MEPGPGGPFCVNVLSLRAWSRWPFLCTRPLSQRLVQVALSEYTSSLSGPGPGGPFCVRVLSLSAWSRWPFLSTRPLSQGLAQHGPCPHVLRPRPHIQTLWISENMQAYGVGANPL
jgi:hypothetical protein